ncbi:hypothetical protein SAMN05428969_2816 [Devosia sp. YR412]|uniref:hypothetical protein n=1 Tax=Devosia sp. YR412 TaxID=1881030 RepID=UPI0008BFEC77|nr:hypothetical protein [Devosia sp. YR412]SEQ37658.1 hypothetical protein SAMN05428969_2816 [Devosia sp. YR412]
MTRMENILLLVGRLNYSWTNTESMLIYLIAHLMKTSKESAIVVFLTLNTTRARLDLIDRLAKMRSTHAETRAETLKITGRLKAESRLRNKYNHCIYSFDPSGTHGYTQLMRIGDTEDQLKYGKVDAIDDNEIDNIRHAIDNIGSVNRQIWEFLRLHQISA